MSDTTRNVLIVIGIIIAGWVVKDSAYGSCVRDYGQHDCDDMIAREEAFGQ